MSGSDAAVTILLWLAGCDGPLVGEEIAAITRVACGSKAGARSVVASFSRASRLGYEDLRRSFVTVMSMTPPGRKALLQAAISVAIADGEISPSESHALRLVADACFGGVDGERALASGLAASGRRLNTPGNPSDPAWWERHERRAVPVTPGSRLSITSTRGFRELRDLALLGLGPGADASAIRDAFRRASRMLHPDRLVGEDERTQQEALAQFRAVREAYERLTAP